MTAKTILITGCSSGIGYDAVKTLSARGWQVLATCKQDKDVARLRGEGHLCHRLDYADPDSIAAAVEWAVDVSGGTIDALFNNGAHATPGAVEDLPRDALRAIFEANFFGVADLTNRIIPIMRAQGHGRIIQCSSVLGFAAMPWRGAYNATKFAMEGLSDTLRLELRESGLNVILIQPGPITTRIRQNSIPHFERWIDVAHSARKEEYLALKDRLYKDRGPDPFELPPSAVTKKLIHALEARKPKRRYMVTTPTYIAHWLRRLAPTGVMDWMMTR